MAVSSGLTISAAFLTATAGWFVIDWFFQSDVGPLDDLDSPIEICRTAHPDVHRNPSADGGISRFVTDDRHGLCLYGSLTGPESLNIAAFNGRNVDLIVVRSSGGPARLWLHLAERLTHQPRSVLVDGLCASSCAAYIFPSGREKLVPEGSLVIWHGGPVNDPAVFERIAGGLSDTDRATALADFLAIGRRTEELYARWRVDSALLADTLAVSPGLEDIIAADGRPTHQAVGFALPPEVLTSCYAFTGLNRMWHPGDALDVVSAGNGLFGSGWVARLPGAVDQDACTQ